jgi:type II secretory pathway pseudopilin PulG
MRRACGECGFTLVELLVGMTMALVVFGVVLSVLNTFQWEDRADTQRNEAQDTARNAIDRMSQELRNVAASSAGSPGTLEDVGPYDVVFQMVAGTTPPVGTSNATNQMRVRYCLDTSNPSSETVWRETQVWTTTAAPALPSLSTCAPPASGSPWTSAMKMVTNLTNQNNSQNRPLIICGSPTVSGNACTSETTSTTAIRSVEVHLYVDVNPGHRPGETDLTSGIYFRNGLAAPTANATASQVNNKYFLLDGSSSYDPNGQLLAYQWYQGCTCATPCGAANAISAANTSQTTQGPLAAGTYNYALIVTNTGGLTACATVPAVTVQ